MDILQTIIASAHTRVLKEPRGFMKILQFVFTICAFATTTSYLEEMKLSVTCKPNDVNTKEVVTLPLSYDFKLYELDGHVCNGKRLTFQQDFSSDSVFYVTVGVLAFLFTIGDLVLYIIFHRNYTEDIRIPTLDFVLHCVFSLLFLAGSSAWANSLSSLKTATTIQTITDENPVVCGNNACEITDAPEFSKLNISIILGFLNLFLFASNLWFIYKETSFFSGKTDPAKSPNAEPGV